jgi:hypothetical protein
VTKAVLAAAPALMAALALPCLAAKSSKPASRRPTAGRAFFALVIRHGMRVDGKLVDEPELPTDRPYRLVQGNGSVAALDSSFCVAHFNALSKDADEALPSRVIDRGCTGLLATSTLDWAGHAPTPMTQSRLDQTYSHMARLLFEK